MSTHECFERHKTVAQEYEGKARMRLEDVASRAAAAEDVPSQPTGNGLSPAVGKAVRAALAQQSLAVREYREAARLRPRDVDTRSRLRAAVNALRAMEGALEGPKPVGLRRFLAHYNLSIRYWDLGKARQAIAEAEQACDELRKAGLGDKLGCAEKNRCLMEHVQSKYRDDQQRLLESVAKHPQAAARAYELGVLYFDKRMLLRAEAQLKHARELARAASALHLVENDRHQMQVKTLSEMSPSAASLVSVSESPSLHSRSQHRIRALLEDLGADLEFIGTLRRQWCVEEDAGKEDVLQETGVRDARAPNLLPCLHSRFEQDSGSCESCERWWAMICTSGALSRTESKLRVASRGACKSSTVSRRPHWYAARD